MRLFFAVDFSDAVKNEIQRAIDGMGIQDPPWHWVSTRNHHVTLKFLGETPDREIQPLCECARDVCRTFEPFMIRLGRLGAFPNLSRPRVLFFEIEQGAEPLHRLARALDRSFGERLGTTRDKRPFRAHATIARVKKFTPPDVVERLKAAPPLGGATQTVENLTLFKSELRPKGPIYHDFKGFALAKSK